MYINELGHLSLALVMGLSLLQVFVAFSGSTPKFLNSIALTSVLLSTFSIIVLIIAMAQVDLSMKIVHDTSHISKSLFYRISSLWAGHEGSLMLWTWFLILCNAIGCWRINNDLKPSYAIAGGLIVFAVLGFVLFFSSPWLRIDVHFLIRNGNIIEGQGGNPLLQDPYLAIHPPLLYLGYTFLIIPFAATMAVLMNKGRSTFPLAIIRNGTLIAWIFLTLGIGFGSYWAWRELGWGGVWAWDPVENSSLMPWIVTTALMHSLLLTGRSGQLKLWSMFLAITAFALSILGMFLVRSGIIDSVHSFAQDAARGIYILILLLLITASGYFLLITNGEAVKTRYDTQKKETSVEFISREGFLIINNWLLITSALIVLLGTLYPLLNSRVSAGAPYFNFILSFFMVPLLLLAAAAPLLTWGKQKNWDKKLYIPPLMATILTLLILIIFEKHRLANMIGTFTGSLVIVSALILKGPQYGGAGAMLHRNGIRLAHFGLGLCAVSIVFSGMNTVEKNLIFQPFQTYEIAGFNVKLKEIEDHDMPSYISTRGVFEISRKGQKITQNISERRFYKVEKMETREVAIRPNGLHSIYIALGKNFENGGTQVSLRYIPFINMLWAGSLIMVLGAFFCFIGPLIHKTKAKNNSSIRDVPKSTKKGKTDE